MVHPFIIGVVAWETGTLLWEVGERLAIDREARRVADDLGKGVLIIGHRRPGHFTPPAPKGPLDASVDIDPDVLELPNGYQADVRSLPFETGRFGSCVFEHVAEHLDTPKDVQLALDECRRVADNIYVVGPFAPTLRNLFNPRHTLNVIPTTDGLSVASKPLRTR